MNEDENKTDNETTGSTTESAKTHRRPKKRQRLDAEQQDPVIEDPAASTIPLEDHTKNPERPATPRLSGALPSFPLPILPNAPSKKDLALQGLDKALIDAEIVHHTMTLAIPLSSDHGGTRLSERIRRRLRDLGITKLFAGECIHFGKGN